MPDPRTAPTIIDVARRAGVSKSVVSRTLSGSGGVAAGTQERVRLAAAELGYVANAMARGMVARRTHTIGAFVRDASNPYYGHLLTAMQERAAARGYRVVTATGSGSFAVSDERRALETLVGLQVEGLVVCSGLVPVADVLQHARRVPTVLAGRPARDEALSSVYCDEIHGGRGMADHLWSLGHRRIMVVTLRPERSLTQAPRTAEMARRLRELGADVVEAPDEETRAGGGIDGLVARLLADRAITAVMAPTDPYALEILEALDRRGLRAPDALSVTGYDGVAPLTTPLLGLTTWVQPLADLGTRAVDEVVSHVEGLTTDTRHQAINGQLISGRTAGPPRR
ncbi:LacI family DNA-binding transcriptional regulator [Pseudonocardia alaniniphila]|uniref:LacI family transcriptional regulator n=1 Tax=Pseudonocardia alaniniphila TaxID=75291 RepID=A0ABS9TB64_9PSEU|nr:LacI family DNA-binding transcriptional regulator [Pseudonocardia alaniniphila]MCH6165531.1 LacI family transcriptional regulator [Pseudonocardia alaniniphila]